MPRTSWALPLPRMCRDQTLATGVGLTDAHDAQCAAFLDHVDLITLVQVVPDPQLRRDRHLTLAVQLHRNPLDT